MKKLVVCIAVILAMIGASATVDATKALAGSIHGDVVGDGGSDNSYCGSFEASYGKTVYMVGPFGGTWYTCKHFGWTNDAFLYERCNWCYNFAWWHQPASFYSLPRDVNLYAWDSF